MNCPKCNNELVNKFYKATLDVEICPHCRGMWLDFNELDKLEDMEFDADSQKGSLIHYQTKTEFLCPHCQTKLDEFQYRLYDLKIDACIEKQHGFWLDEGEDERVMEIMNQRAQEMQRKTSAESEWKQVLKNMHSFFRKK
jgi:Zn-finger nucleic acid-binding protein